MKLMTLGLVKKGKNDEQEIECDIQLWKTWLDVRN